VSDHPLFPNEHETADIWVMAETSVKEKTAISREDRWRDRIGAQARSGRSVQQFCKEQGFSAYSFYSWRRRLREEQMLRFALVDRGAVVEKDGIVASLELILNGGERLRIGAGADTATLRTVLEALRS
jgi:hypothetical protein